MDAPVELLRANNAWLSQLLSTPPLKFSVMTFSLLASAEASERRMLGYSTDAVLGVQVLCIVCILSTCVSIIMRELDDPIVQVHVRIRTVRVRLA